MIYGDLSGKGIPSRGNSKCQGPRAGACLACSRNLENSTSIGVAGVKGRGLGVSKGVGVSAGGEVAKNGLIYLIYILKRHFWLFCGK